MPAQKRFKTQYPGVHFIVSRPGTPNEDRVFYIDYRMAGKRLQEKAGFASKGMTAAKANNMRSDRMRGKEPSNKARRAAEEATKQAEAGRWTVDRIFYSYMENRRQNKAWNVDRLRYEKYLKQTFGAKEPAEIAPLEVDRVRLRLLKKLSPQTVKHVLNLFTWTINYATKKNLCGGLKFHVQKPTVSNNKTEDLTQEQLQRLVAAIEADPNTQVGNLMKMALFTGMRAGELFRLEWSHVDFDRGFIRIVAPKGGVDQTIPLNDAARHVLKAHPRAEGTPYIFPGANGGRRVTARVGANRIKKRAGLPADFRPIHGLRHVFASNLASSGKVDMYVLQRLLTHKNPIMTQRYSHLRDSALRDASNLAGELVTAITAEKKEVAENEG